MIKYRNLAFQGALAFSLLTPTAFAQELVKDDLITGSNLTTPWQSCDSDAVVADVTTLDAGGCAFRTTPADAGITYRMSCGIVVVKFASITLAFLDANDNTLATASTEVVEHVTGGYSVTLESPPGTVTAAIGIYGEPGSGFQDCVLLDATPPPEPTKGSIAGVTWFDETADSVFESDESVVAGTQVSLFEGTKLLAQTETGTNGDYYFGNLDVGVCYTVSFAAADATLELGAPGGDNDAMAGGQTNEICLTDAAPDTTHIDAAFIAIPPVVPPADNVICGVAWVDMNSNGVFDGTDSTLANVNARLFDAEGLQIDSLSTDENGNYAFFKLENGDYSVGFVTPDGHEPTTASGQPMAGSSYINGNGQTAVFNLPASSNTGPDSACTIQNVNAGYVQLPIVLAPTIAKDDSVVFDVGVNFGIDFLGNDMPCDGSVSEVNLLGHNVPGSVTYDAASQQISVTNTTAFGTYSIEYGIRGACGSYDTATIKVELLEVQPPVVANAPDAPVCQIETGGSRTRGGVDVFNDKDEFASSYNFYDRDRKLVTTVDSSDPSHRLFISYNYGTKLMDPYVGSYEIEWTGSHYGFNQLAIYYVAAVENGIESKLTECARSQISPIAIDLGNKGRIQRLAGDYSVDIDGDGIKEPLSQWFAPSVGILVTADASGEINGNHLFGNVPGVYADGFEELATLDANRDGQLTNDELSTLAIWIDANSDAVVDEGELSGLADHQIVGLAVSHYKYMARATMSNGKSVLMEDVWLPMAPLASR